MVTRSPPTPRNMENRPHTISGKNANKRDTKKWNLLHFSETSVKWGQNQFIRILLYFAPPQLHHPPPTQSETCFSRFTFVHLPLSIRIFFMPSLLCISILFLFDQQDVLVQGRTDLVPSPAWPWPWCLFCPSKGENIKETQQLHFATEEKFQLNGFVNWNKPAVKCNSILLSGFWTT